jgi:hypothetical protein
MAETQIKKEVFLVVSLFNRMSAHCVPLANVYFLLME